MSDLTRIYVVRHGESEGNVGNLASENSELGSSLTENGRRQAKVMADKFKNIDFAAIFSSELARTKETAEIIKNGRSLSVIPNNNTNERSIYKYSRAIKKEEADVEEEMLNETKNLTDEEKMSYKHTPQMESVLEGALRLLSQFKEIAREYKGKKVLVVSHGNVMRSLLTYIGYAGYNELPVGAIKNIGYFVLETDGENFSVTETYDIEKQKGAIRVW